MSRSSLVFQSISALHQEAESAHLKLVHSDKNTKEVLTAFEDEPESPTQSDDNAAGGLQKAIIQTQPPLPKLPNSTDIFARIEALAGAGDETARQAEKQASILAHLDDMLNDAEASLTDDTQKSHQPESSLTEQDETDEDITKAMADIRRSVEENVEGQAETSPQLKADQPVASVKQNETEVRARLADDPQWQGIVRSMVRDVLTEELPDTIQKMVRDALKDITREGTSLPRPGGKMRTSRFRR